MQKRFRDGTLISLIGLFLCYQNCGNSQSSSSTVVPATAGPNYTQFLPVNGSEPYVLPITVGCGYLNEPCVSIRVCSPSSGKCVQVNNVLVDTGSYGLRVFSSAVSGLSLNQFVDSSGSHLAECQSFKDGSSDWGMVALANVQLGERTAKNIPIQVIDSQFASAPSDCTGVETDPAHAGYNAILGVGVFLQDCGLDCTSAAQANNRIYFNCQAGQSNCGSHSVSVRLEDQVSNPAAFLDSDNNGIAIQLNNISSYGETNPTGYLVLGIGTQADNTPGSSVQMYSADSSGNFQTKYSDKVLDAFIDSGSNGVFYTASPSLPGCSNLIGFYCPSSAQNFFATQISSDNANNFSISVSVANADDLANTNPSATAFNNLGGPLNGFFDWGMPFFFGRTIYVGFEHSSSPLGKGTYWAY